MIKIHCVKFSRNKNNRVEIIPWLRGGGTALRRQRQVDLCEFEVSLVYRESSRPVKATPQKSRLEKPK